MNTFSISRWWAIVVKEFIQMRRDRMTFGMMVGIPLMQLILFGFAINSDPKHLPTAVLVADESIYVRTILSAIEKSGYFQIVQETYNENDSARWLALGEVQFVLTIPPHFSKQLVRGERPVLLLEADATDPATMSNALGTIQILVSNALDRDLKGQLQSLRSHSPAFELRIHRQYNPEGITQYHIVPGLMGVVLTMTMVIITALAMTRERERGTIENLLATPVRPIEVMIGKLVPYILVGYIQVILILSVAYWIFQVPMKGSLELLMGITFLFIAANLSVGITFSTIAKNQLQAVQMSFFFFLPSILISGFMFPFRGMPKWAQYLGEVLPNTHFLRLVRGILLKGNGWPESWPQVWPIMLFMVVVIILGMLRYKETLD